MRKAVLDMIYELAKKNKDIFFIGSDLGTETLKEFKRDFPERFLMEGVNEQALIGMAAGLALEGKIPYVNTIATFITRRCFEQIVLDCCLHNAKVRLIANGAGVVYAPLGPTHLAIDDIGILRCIPNMTIVAVADADEMKRLMPQTVDYNGPIYIRLAKGNDPIVSSDKFSFKIGKAIEMRKGNDVLIVTTGITLKFALEASKTLEKEGINATVLHMHTIKPLDEEALIKAAKNVKGIITIEEHNVKCGLGSAVVECLSQADIMVKTKIIGIPDVFPDGYGSQEYLLEKYGITTENLVRQAKDLVNL
ncbi:transketolase [Candidatus Woesearchaeota archaeon]|nr:transketolase [Candidatus Woesearchaeota archaeon]